MKKDHNIDFLVDVIRTFICWVIFLFVLGVLGQIHNGYFRGCEYRTPPTKLMKYIPGYELGCWLGERE